ncbi:MAG: hypothetical protein HY529_05295 [Chloroflexi bacterium]|nr:hypothetical protein [Chloroflexota bacterium]
MIDASISIDKIQQLEQNPDDRIPDKRFYLWSIIELMDRFYAPTFALTMATLTQIRDSVLFELSHGNEANHTWVTEKFQEVKRGLEGIHFSRVLIGQISRVEEVISKPGCSGIEMSTLLVELSNNIIMELTASCFLRIPENRHAYYVQTTPPFGTEVADAFPLANNDISSAGRCLALDEWTACVFHLMRVLEIGLRDLAKRVGLDNSAMELENWKTVIDQIEKRIRELDQAPKSITKSEVLQFYSEAATCFRSFKDAWRNHVSHSRANYSERDAITVYNSVDSFMQMLAKHTI